MSRIILLGPQRGEVTLGKVAAELELDGPCAVISAGWQERESEVEELDAHLGSTSINLKLHQRGEEIFREDEAFREGHRAHMDRVKRLQDAYRVRLAHYLDAVAQLLPLRNKMSEDLFEEELEQSYEVVRRHDAQHLSRISELHETFREDFPPDERDSIQHHSYELAEIMDRCAAVVITGGHVAVLLNRLRLLNLEPFLREKTVIAWSAGAMCLGGQVVLFHDSPPQGKGYAEMFEAGLGLFEGILPLPHADRRLQLDDTYRVSQFARRFDPLRCMTLNQGARLDFEDGKLKAAAGVQKLGTNGTLEGVELS